MGGQVRKRSRKEEEKIGGANIKPAARRGIHSYCLSCNSFCWRAMGRYGLDTVQARNKQIAPTDQEQGHDEVDNVMSKMARPASPVPVRKGRVCRRNSYDMDNDCTEDETDEDNILSKSSPPAFPYYSDQLYGSLNTTVQLNEAQNSRNESQNSRNESATFNHRSTPNQPRITANQHNRSQSQMRQRLPVKKESSVIQLLFKIILMCLVAILAVFYMGYYPSETTKINNSYDKFNIDVTNLGEKYKVKDTSILQVRTGVATIFEKQDTGSFILAYNSNNNFNPVKFNSFVEDLAATSSRFLRNNSDTNHYVLVDTMNLKTQTEKEFMNEYEEGVMKTGVMLVKDVDNIPSQIAMAFHYYCDEYSPLVRRSAIFFTLNLAKCSNKSDPKSTHEYIEKCLAKKWSNVGEDRIGPLLTRVVNIVVDVTSLF
ncbi:uncharacterized protein LOC112054798 isoform X2 [Bicyclus anynana]|uniref:Uncharacterized protein LOC112054798 isoform X2 n=1 Tax=Bicyclus anynana TaxID=110368 RepID=A0A6J1NRW8_BICAN|nr:uncharacterized protein LOC112054798 isoform X2 [Bicyclus anynana]